MTHHSVLWYIKRGHWPNNATFCKSNSVDGNSCCPSTCLASSSTKLIWPQVLPLPPHIHPPPPTPKMQTFAFHHELHKPITYVHAEKLWQRLRNEFIWHSALMPSTLSVIPKAAWFCSKIRTFMDNGMARIWGWWLTGSMKELGHRLWSSCGSRGNICIMWGQALGGSTPGSDGRRC